MAIADFAAGAIAAVIGWVTVVIGEAAALDAFLSNRTFIIARTVRYTDSFAVWIERGSCGLLAVLVCGAIAIVGAWGVLFGLNGLTCAANANAVFAIFVA